MEHFAHPFIICHDYNYAKLRHSPTELTALHQTTTNRCLTIASGNGVVEAAHDESLQMEERLRFETLIADLSLRFVNASADHVDQEIEDAQRAICECLGLEHSSLWQASIQNPGELVLTHLYRDPELPQPPERMSGIEFFPWCLAKLMLECRLLSATHR